MNETPEQREARLLAEAEAENQADMVHEFQESLSAKPLVSKDANFLMRGWTQTQRLPRLILQQIERGKTRRKTTKPRRDAN